jgi:hypothetical protein
VPWACSRSPFPLHPPGRPASSRAGELDPALPTWSSTGTGTRSAFRGPPGLVEVVVRPGETHALRKDPAGVAEVAVTWLRALLAG